MPSGPYTLSVSKKEMLFGLYNEITGKDIGLVRSAFGCEEMLEQSMVVLKEKRELKRAYFFIRRHNYSIVKMEK